MPGTSQLVEAAVAAVRDAMMVCRGVQRTLDTVRAITKDDRSPVTVGDFASQAVVIHQLTQKLGPIHMVAEESSGFLRDPAHASHLQAATQAAGTVWPGVDARTLLDTIDAGSHAGGEAEGFWTLDPIDGTKGFLRGQQYAVCLAYIRGGEVVIGVLGCPNLPASATSPLDVPDPTGSLFVAERSEGAWRLGAASERERLMCSTWTPGSPVSMCESFEGGHSDQSTQGRILARLGPSGPPARLDSQCKYAVVARGQADVYLRLPAKRGYVERIWDHAAGALIAAEAGCVVADIHGKSLDFARGRGLERNRGIVVAPPALHERILAAIAELGVGRDDAGRV